MRVAFLGCLTMDLPRSVRIMQHDTAGLPKLRFFTVLTLRDD